MRFTSVQDINAPLDFVFEQISDFDSYEAYAMRIGAQVERTDNLPGKQAGLAWNFVGDLRGKTREVDIDLVEYKPERLLTFNCISSGVGALIEMETIALTPKQARLKVSVEVKARSISARLVLQSAKLAKNSIKRKFNHRIWTYANHIESTYGKRGRRV